MRMFPSDIVLSMKSDSHRITFDRDQKRKIFRHKEETLTSPIGIDRRKKERFLIHG